MAGLEENFQERIQELLLCSICYECLTHPKTLECQHTFCYCCLEHYAIESNWNVTCPTCRKEQYQLKTREDLTILDAPLYIKQALDVINDYRRDDDDVISSGNVTAEDNHNGMGDLEDLLEYCFLCDKDGHWQRDCPEEACDMTKVDVEADDFDKKLNKLEIEINPSELKDNHEEEILMFTQEFTFGKICNKIFRRKEEKDDKPKYTTKRETMSSVKGNLPKLKKSAEAKNGGAAVADQAKQNSFPKHILPAAAVTGLRYRPKYVPGTLTKTRQVPAMMGYGLPLKSPPGVNGGLTPIRAGGQFHQQNKPRVQQKPQETETKCVSSKVRTRFGRPPFMLPCSRSRKVVFAVKF